MPPPPPLLSLSGPPDKERKEGAVRKCSPASCAGLDQLVPVELGWLHVPWLPGGCCLAGRGGEQDYLWRSSRLLRTSVAQTHTRVGFWHFATGSRLGAGQLARSWAASHFTHPHLVPAPPPQAQSSQVGDV